MTLFTVALEKVDILPPDRVTDNTSVLTLKNLVFEPLLGWDDGAARPALFSHWTHSPDGRRWEFFIRPDAAFHDGAPCLPDDILRVVGGIVNSVDTFGMKWSYARYFARAEIKAGQANSIIVENPEPFADILDIFSDFHISRLDPQGQATLGTGPYRIADFTPGQQAVLARVNAGAGSAHIRLNAVPLAEDRWQMLCGGAADAAIHLDHMEHPPKPDDCFIWGSRINPLSVMFYLNCSQGLFASAAARFAANLAVDKDALARTVFRGFAVPSSTIVSPAHLGMRTANIRPIPYDPVRARALLEGIGGPGKVRLRAPLAMPERSPGISRFVADALAAVGFDVTVEAEPDRPEYARQVGRKQIGDLALFDSSPHSTFRVLNDKISSTERAIWWQGYDNAEAERLILAGSRAVGPEAREAGYAACLRHLNADPPWLYLVNPVSLFAARKGAARLALTATGALGIAAA